MMCSNDASNWDRVAKSMVFRDRSNASSDNEENHDDADEDDDE